VAQKLIKNLVKIPSGLFGALGSYTER